MALTYLFIFLILPALISCDCTERSFGLTFKDNFMYHYFCPSFVPGDSDLSCTICYYQVTTPFLCVVIIIPILLIVLCIVGCCCCCTCCPYYQAQERQRLALNPTTQTTYVNATPQPYAQPYGGQPYTTVPQPYAGGQPVTYSSQPQGYGQGQVYNAQPYSQPERV